MHDGQLVVFAAAGSGGTHLSLTAGPTAPLELILLGGRPIGEPVAWYGPFVMNTKAEVAQAMEDYRAGRLGNIPPEHVHEVAETRWLPLDEAPRLLAYKGEREMTAKALERISR